MEFSLPARAPFSLQSVIESHGWLQLLPFTVSEAALAFDYVVELTSGRVLSFHVCESNKGVRVTGQTSLSKPERDEVAQIVTWMCALDQDFSGFYKAASREPKLAQVEENAQGRFLRSATLFEDVVKTILTTNTTWSGTKRMVMELVNAYGAPLLEAPERRAFPTPDRLAAVDIESFQKKARLGYRAPYILELAQRTAAGDLDLESWKTTAIPTTKLRKKLLSLKGVGPYAAASLLMLLGHYDSVPVDSWAFKLVSHEWYDGRPVGRAEVEKAFADWGQWQALAYWFWDWTYLQQQASET